MQHFTYCFVICPKLIDEAFASIRQRKLGQQRTDAESKLSKAYCPVMTVGSNFKY